MRAQHRNADAGSAHLDIAVHDLARFVEHFHLLFGVAVFGKRIYLRYQIVSQLIGEFRNCRIFFVNQLFVLFQQFVHGSSARARCRLIRGHVNAFDVRDILNGFQRHNHLNGSAIGIGNNVPRTVQCVFGIYFGHHQRNIVVHAERARIVYHNGSVFGNGIGKLQRCSSAGRNKSNVNSLEIVVMFEFFHGNFLTAKSIC